MKTVWKRIKTRIDGQEVRLPPRVLDTYRVLEAQKGQPLPAEELERRVTDEVSPERPGHYAHVYVNRLRQELAQAGIHREIYNVSGLGYWMVPPDRRFTVPRAPRRRKGTRSA